MRSIQGYQMKGSTSPRTAGRDCLAELPDLEVCDRGAGAAFQPGAAGTATAGENRLVLHPPRPAMAGRVTNIDLKLLAVVNELQKTRSVSQTAENLRLSQSTISMSLARLRRHFHDPLFVRTSAGMEPTPHGMEIIHLLKQAEGFLQSALEYHHAAFDPLTSQRRFQICSTDVVQVTLMPKLIKRLKVAAPGMGLDLVPVSEHVPRLLECGEIDLAIGFLSTMGAGFYQQRLFPERFVCAVRAGHPRIHGSLSLAQFQGEMHAVAATSGTGHGVLDQALELKRVRRQIGLRVPGFLGLGPILAATDVIAVLPEQLGTFFAATQKIKLFPLPFAMEPYFIAQHWHERYNHDPANIWLRGLIADLFFQAPLRISARAGQTRGSGANSSR